MLESHNGRKIKPSVPELFINTLCYYLAVVYILGFIVSALGLGTKTSYIAVQLLALAVVSARLKPPSISALKIAIIGQVYIVGYLVFFWNYDLSIDGNTYHSSIIHRLLAGWNMFSETDTPYYSGKPWIENYPKNVELLFAIFSTPFGSTDFGRVAKIIFLEIAGALAYLFGKRVLNLPSSISLVLASATSLNPVVVSQIFTRYIDDIAYLSIASMILSSFLNKGLFAIGFLFFVIGVKYSSLLIAIPILALLLFINRFLLNFRSLPKLSELVVVFTIGIFSSSYYVYNFITKNNPLYPIFETKLVEAYTVEGVIPESLKESGLIARFLISNLSFPGGLNVEQIEAKDDLFVRISKGLSAYQYYELYKYGFSGYLIFPDCKINGFGFFWPFLMIISSVILFTALIQEFFRRMVCTKNDNLSLAFLLIGLAIYLTSILFPANWWARLIAHIWLLPIFTAGFLFKKPYRSSRITALIVALIMTLNSTPTLFSIAQHNSKMNTALKTQIRSARMLAKDKDSVWIHMKMVEFADERIKLGLKGLNLKFHRVDEIEDFLRICKGERLFHIPLWIPSTPPLFCLTTQKS